ncbi:MAG: thermonuclease family protein [Halobacteriales archaeon]
MTVQWLRAVVLICLLLLAGCSFTEGTASPTPAPTTAAPPTESPTPTSAPTPTPTQSPTPTPPTTTQSAANTSIPVTVIEVRDGDTVIVEDRQGDRGLIRLIGIDAPERFNGTDPEEYGVENTSAGRACLRTEANESTTFLRELILGQEVDLRFDKELPARGPFGRYFGYLYLDETNVNKELVRTGHARVFNDEFAKSEPFYAVQETAQAEKRGLWTCRSINATTTSAFGSVDPTH